MDHVAIMQPKLKMLEKILAGEKTIESRWYKAKRSPWDAIKSGDTVYFKNSSQPITAMAVVDQVTQYNNLTPENIDQLLQEYGSRLGLDHGQLSAFRRKVLSSRYAILIFLKKPQLVPQFTIRKTGFGAMASWITVENIGQITV